MPRTRTPPPIQPVCFEKSANHIDISLTDTELVLWKAVYGQRNMIDAVRIVVNREALRLAGVKSPEPASPPSDPEIGHAARDEIHRHVRAMRGILNEEKNQN